jgi:hypothetical protein
MSKSPRKHPASPKGEMKLSIRFGQREDGMMFMEYREENAKDVEREALGTVEQRLSPAQWRMESNPDAKRAHSTICQHCKENEAEQASEYCTVCHVMFVMLVHS